MDDEKQALNTHHLFSCAVKTIFIILITTGSSILVSMLGVGKESIVMVFLLGVLFTTVFTSSYVYGVISSFASLMILNFLFTEPRFTLVIYNENDFILLLFFLVTAVVSGVVTSRLQQQMELAAKNERTAQVLYKIASGFLSVNGTRNIVQRGISYIHQYTNKCECTITLKENQETYSGSYALPHVFYREYTIDSPPGALGVMQVFTDQTTVDDQTQLIIQAVVTQLGIALDREYLYNQQEKTRLTMESEKLRAALLRSVAHDLRSPLTVLLGAGNLLADNYELLSDDKRKKLATDISEEIIWLTNLVENILDMTRLNESHLVLQKENEVVDDVVSEAVSHVERLLRERNFTVKLPENVIMVPMDGRLIVRVLINLLENAVLHTEPEASIELSATIKGNNLEMVVSDSGHGINESFHEKLFERFVTHDKIVSDGRRGIGLGLSNCKALVEAHGGLIRAESNHPQGTRFVFTLPLEDPTIST